MRESLVLSRRDLDFLLHEWLQVEQLTKRERFAAHDRATFDAVVDLAAEIAVEHFAPHNRAADEHEPHVVDGKVVLVPEVAAALKVFGEAGLAAGTLPEELGGLQLPQVVSKAATVWFQAANVGSSAYPFLTMANAHLLLAHGSPEQVETYVRPMAEGRWFGTMALSEPQAGSSLADITTKAEPQDDGSYRLTGTKMWISGGDHELSENIVHLVLAKIPGGPAGVKGISLFVVPKFLPEGDGVGERNDVVLAGLNHKMGYRGTTNTLLNFGEGVHTPGGRPGAVGWLVGEENRGLAAMFHMMNEARVGVGLGATALGYTGYLHALDYARTRTQGRPPAGKDPLAPPVPIVEHSDVKRMLLAAKSYVEGGLALGLYCAKLVDEETTADTEEERTRRTRCSRCSPRSRRAGPRSGAWPPTTWPSRCTAATATPATSPSSSSTGTTGSTRSTRARSASRAWTCWAARWWPAAARACGCWRRPSRRRRRGRRAPSGPTSPRTSTRRWPGWAR